MLDNNSTVMCDPRLSARAECDASWHEAAEVLWSVFLVAELTAAMMVIGKIIKRFYKQGTLRSFGVFVMSFFLIGSLLRIVYFLIKLTDFSAAAGRPFMFWLFTEPTRWIISGYLLLSSFWIQMYRKSNNFQLSLRTLNVLKIGILPLIVVETSGIVATAYLASQLIYTDDEEALIKNAFKAAFYVMALVLFFVDFAFPLTVFPLAKVSKAAAKIRGLSIFIVIACVGFQLINVLMAELYQVAVENASPIPWVILTAFYLGAEFLAISICSQFLHGGETAEGALAGKVSPTVAVLIDSKNVGQHEVVSTDTALSKSQKVKLNLKSTARSSEDTVKASEETNKPDSVVSARDEPKQFKEETELKAPEILLGKEIFLWVESPNTLWSLFKFPTPIDDNAVRIKGAIVIAYLILHMLLDRFVNFPYFIWYVVFSLAIRFMFASRFSIESMFYVYVIEKLTKHKKRYAPGKPKRINIMNGMMILAIAGIVRFTVSRYASNWIIGAFITMAGLESLFGICAVCATFALLMVLDLLPASYCYECRVLFKEKNLPKSASRKIASLSKQALYSVGERTETLPTSSE